MPEEQDAVEVDAGQDERVFIGHVAKSQANGSCQIHRSPCMDGRNWESRVGFAGIARVYSAPLRETPTPTCLVAAVGLVGESCGAGSGGLVGTRSEPLLGAREEDMQ